jgi:hypothetical protein
MTDNDLRGQTSADALRGFARLAATVRGAGVCALVLVSPEWRRALADAAELESFAVWAVTLGLPENLAGRVIASELSRTRPMGMAARTASARTRLLSGAPYDGTNRRFEAMVEAWREKYPARSDGDARAALLSLLDSGIFTPEAMAAMRESDVNYDE